MEIAEINKQTEQIIGNSFDSPSRICLNIIPCGAGKTYHTAKFMIKNDDNSFMLSEFKKSNMNLGSKNIDFYYGLPIAFSKKDVCINKDAKKLMRLGMTNINVFCDLFCKIKDTCPYNEQTKYIFENGKFLGVHQHLNTGLPINFINQKHPKNVIIDENFLSAITYSFAFRSYEIRPFIRFCIEMKKQKEHSTVFEDLQKLLLNYQTLMEYSEDPQYYGNVINNVVEFFDKNRIEDIHKFVNDFSRSFISIYLDKFKIENNKIPKRIFLYDFIGTLYPFYEFIKERPDFNADRFKKYLTIDFNDKKFYYSLSQTFISPDNIRNILHTKIKKLIINDATGDKGVYEKILGEDIEVFNADIPFKCKILQITGGKYLQSSILNYERTYKKLTDAIKIYANTKKEDKVLVIAKSLFFRDSYKIQSLADNLEYIHYYGLRGSNSYENVKNVILFGTPQIPIHTQDIIKDCLELTDDDIFQNFTLAEMIQALHRIRPLRNEDREALLLSDVDLKQNNDLIYRFTIDNLIRVLNGDILKLIPENGISKNSLRELSKIEDAKLTDILRYFIDTKKIKIIKKGRYNIIVRT